MTPRKKKNKKKSVSLLSRFIKSSKSKVVKTKGNGRPAARGETASDSEAKTKAKPLSPLERSIREIKHMANVGASDPERLAMILSSILSTEQEKTRKSQEKFDAMINDIVERDEQGPGDRDDGGG